VPYQDSRFIPGGEQDPRGLESEGVDVVCDFGLGVGVASTQESLNKVDISVIKTVEANTELRFGVCNSIESLEVIGIAIVKLIESDTKTLAGSILDMGINTGLVLGASNSLESDTGLGRDHAGGINLDHSYLIDFLSNISTNINLLLSYEGATVYTSSFNCPLSFLGSPLIDFDLSNANLSSLGAPTSLTSDYLLNALRDTNLRLASEINIHIDDIIPVAASTQMESLKSFGTERLIESLSSVKMLSQALESLGVGWVFPLGYAETLDLSVSSDGGIPFSWCLPVNIDQIVHVELGTEIKVDQLINPEYLLFVLVPGKTPIEMAGVFGGISGLLIKRGTFKTPKLIKVKVLQGG